MTTATDSGRQKLRRISSVDACRTLALFAVILIHTKPFLNPVQDYGPWGYVGVVLDQIARFGVPFFFAVAGKFFAERIHCQGELKAFLHYGLRIYSAFLFWSLIYLCVPNVDTLISLGYLNAVLGKIESTSVLQLLTEGTAPPLWFLNALIVTAGIATLFSTLRLNRFLLAVAVLAYMAGLVSGPYSIACFGEDTGTRRGVLFAILPFAIGFQAAARQTGFDTRTGLFLLAAGYGLQFFEAFGLWHWFGVYPLELDNLLGTPLIAAGVFQIAMAWRNRVLAKPLARIGRYALGIYASHWLFVKLLLPIDRYAASVLWELSYPLLVLAVSLELSRAMARIPLLHRFVR